LPSKPKLHYAANAVPIRERYRFCCPIPPELRFSNLVHRGRMLGIFRYIVDELKDGIHPAFIENLDKAIDHFEKQIQEYPWQTHEERHESGQLILELCELKAQRKRALPPSENPGQVSEK